MNIFQMKPLFLFIYTFHSDLKIFPCFSFLLWSLLFGVSIKSCESLPSSASLSPLFFFLHKWFVSDYFNKQFTKSKSKGNTKTLKPFNSVFRSYLYKHMQTTFQTEKKKKKTFADLLTNLSVNKNDVIHGQDQFSKVC